ncbi:MAG: ATP-binding protein [Candidatus Competibacteraceae bacterium]|jgi:signal transduction histidine kinase/CheY-like chemotaxis protein|nr:ATP-binding protein [Candidatus Competibacteraceae bacterium]
MLLIGASLTLVTVLVALLNLTYHYRGLERELQERLNNLTEIQAGAIAASLWYLDQRKAQAILESLAAEADLVSAVVLDDKGGLFAEFEKPQISQNTVLQSESDIFIATEDSQRKIGELIITLSRSRLLKERNRLLLITLLFGLTQLAAVLAATALALRSITRPLASITHAMLKLSKDHSQVTIPELDRTDQLGEMAQAVKIFQENAIENQRLREMEIQRTEQLTLARESAEAANQAKSKFLANISHEMRTPLNAIVGLSEVILNRSANYSLPKDFNENIHYINLSAQNLSELINNVLDLSKIEAGKVSTIIEQTNLRELINDISFLYQFQAAQKEITFNLDYAEGLPRKILTDPGKLRQILINLIANAIKFTPKGKAIDLRLFKDQDDLIIQVIDQGIGIPEDRQIAIFDDFEQVDGTVTRRYGGTGLGLSITKKLLTFLGGTIELESIVDKGSKFTVKLPLGAEVIPSENITEPESTQLGFAHDNIILVVEDNPINQITITSIFEDLNLSVHLADDGESGVEKALALKPDLIFMDIHMPKMSGFEATKRIRANPEFEHTPIIALSADAFTEQQEEAYTTGMSGYLTKPIDSVKFINILRKYLRTTVLTECKPG